jgi:hypothetical protein
MKRALLTSVIAATFSLIATAAFGQAVSITSPANGATVGSPVHFSAWSIGGSYPITSMRLYVDNASKLTVSSASLDTYQSLATGSHYVVIVAWNSVGQAFQDSRNITVGSASAPAPTPTPTPTPATGVSVSSPTSGSSVGSPVHFVATTGAPSGRTITSTRIYVDYNSVYATNSGSVNTYVTLGAGSHLAVVQSWDNTGAVYKSPNLTINVGSAVSPTPTPTPTPTPSPTPTSGPYYNNLMAASKWFGSQSLADGALMYSTLRVNPYYSNLAASGMLKDSARYTQVLNWMKWYVAHLNWPDKWGMYGTMYDYNIVNGKVVSAGDADSTDSYAATFLSLAWEAYQTGNGTLQSYVKSISYQLDMIAGVLTQTQQSDGLTWAKPDYQIKYLMDNSEVYRGLQDASSLFNAIGNPAKGTFYGQAAAANKQGILGMWMNGVWAVYKDGIGRLMGPNMGVWYPDASAQVFPVLYQVLPGSDSRSQQAYSRLNSAWPGWTSLSFSGQDPFPWVMVADAAALMGDSTRVNAYINTIQNKYVSKGFPWTWYTMESGWFMRLNAYMMGTRPF